MFGVVGTWRGVYQVIRGKGRLGLLWFIVYFSIEQFSSSSNFVSMFTFEKQTSVVFINRLE